MPSPFPGMNPYLEQDDAWHDFHERFMPAAAAALSPQVDPRYIVKIDEHVYVHELGSENRQLVGRADVAVTRGAEAPGFAATSVLDAPAHVLLPEVDIERHSFVEIRDRRSRQLVTIIELLSPANKQRGPDREQYLRKREELLAGPVHVIEIDLLRGGQRMPMQPLPASDYCVLVSRREERPSAGIWPVLLPARLPEIPVPLSSPDTDARLDLQELLHGIYDAARYGSYIYDGAPDPPLLPAQQAWAENLLNAYRADSVAPASG
ncbi:MAG: DUF4058 family protein [Planctomycetales bacterium]